MAENPWTPGPYTLTNTDTAVYLHAAHANSSIGMVYRDVVDDPEAQARLWQLAPEMAELLEKLATWFETAPTYPPGWMGAKDVPKNARQARDLLARARGET